MRVPEDSDIDACILLFCTLVCPNGELGESPAATQQFMLCTLVPAINPKSPAKNWE